MTTFSAQQSMPSLPVPPLDETLDKYLRAVRHIVSPEQFERTKNSVEEFRNSDLAKQLQMALVNRSKQMRNWIEDWWYDEYNTVREPIAPTLSLAAKNSYYPSLANSQICRAADITYYWLSFWERIKKEKLPITKSRGVIWDMHQYYCLFNSTRVPDLPSDHMARYFRTELEGPCPSFIVVLCRGNLWKVDVLQNNALISPDKFHHIFTYIKQQSKPVHSSVISLTTSPRDQWAKDRLTLISISPQNAASLQAVEECILCVTLTDEEIKDENEFLVAALTRNHQYFWMDKCVNLVVYLDGQMALQGDHSNVDAIAVLHAGDDAAARVRQELWTPEAAEYSIPLQLKFDVTAELAAAITSAEAHFEKTKDSHRVRVLRYHAYGNALFRKNKIYGDTIVQIAMQLSYLKTHGTFAPIYETASTRKFYHGRTETVRGYTKEMHELGRTIMDGKATKSKLRELFLNAYNAHNTFMEECTNARGIDRHLLGLRKTLDLFNKGCSPKRALPSFFSDEAFKASGGGGNFLLSTSFIGYMLDDHDGGFGYVCAMRPDGYGSFYRIGNNRILLCATDWKGSRSNIDAYIENLTWAFNTLEPLFNTMSDSKL